jgi:hypothetical protein
LAFCFDNAGVTAARSQLYFIVSLALRNRQAALRRHQAALHRRHARIDLEGELYGWRPPP